jgi:hypothetical protein
MTSVDSLLQAINERTIAARIGIPHDEARMRYPLRSNTAGGFQEFSDIIGDYYNYHFTMCVSGGGSLSRDEATGRAKEILEREYRRQQGDIVTAFNDAHDGINGGMRVVLDKIADGLKAESVERYVREMFDRHVAPNAWEEKVAIIRQFIAQCGPYLSSSIKAHQPERYAHDYQDLIRSYVSALQRTSSIFRRL